MSRRIVKSQRAERDLIDHFAFIARDKIEPAERFLKVAGEAMELLAEMPGIGRAWESDAHHLQGIRVYPMPAGFRNYLIFYRVIDGGIEIIAILHGARDLGPLMDELFSGD